MAKEIVCFLSEHNIPEGPEHEKISTLNYISNKSCDFLTHKNAMFKLILSIQADYSFSAFEQ